MSDMETEPPDGTLRPQKTSLPKSNDEPMPDYRRMNPFELCSTIESQLRQQSPDLNQKRDRKTFQGNGKRRKQKEPKKKAADPPSEETDNDKCRHHKEIQKLVKMMNGRLSFLEHCIKSEKEFPDLTDDDALVGYQKDHQENSKPKYRWWFHLPQKVAKKLKLSDPIAGTSQPISVKNKFSSLAEKEAKVTPRSQIKQRLQLPPTLKSLQLCSNIKKENYKTIIKDLNKDFPNCDVKLAGKYLKIFTASTDEQRIVTVYLKEKCEEFYMINPPDSHPQKIVIKGLPVSTEIGEIQADLTSQGFCVEKVAQLTRSKTKFPLPIFMVELLRNPDSPDIFQLKKVLLPSSAGRHF
ncbi:uncharacterized protein TNCV_3981821 [Trichonephila clavipes]|nr:uncharacterized protein TNCV_3981821 [Trichonephila clavipes]